MNYLNITENFQKRRVPYFEVLNLTLHFRFVNTKTYFTMNVITATRTGLSSVIDQLQKQKEELTVIYQAAINNGEKLQEVKTLYISLQDVNKRLKDLLRVC